MQVVDDAQQFGQLRSALESPSRASWVQLIMWAEARHMEDGARFEQELRPYLLERLARGWPDGLRELPMRWLLDIELGVALVPLARRLLMPELPTQAHTEGLVALRARIEVPAVSDADAPREAIEVLSAADFKQKALAGQLKELKALRLARGGELDWEVLYRWLEQDTPPLEELCLNGYAVSWDKLDKLFSWDGIKRLRVLKIASTMFTDGDVRRIVEAGPWPALETLDMGSDVAYLSGSIDDGPMTRLLESALLPKLTRLVLPAFGVSQEAALALAHNESFSQLEEVHYAHRVSREAIMALGSSQALRRLHTIYSLFGDNAPLPHWSEQELLAFFEGSAHRQWRALGCWDVPWSDALLGALARQPSLATVERLCLRRPSWASSHDTESGRLDLIRSPYLSAQALEVMFGNDDRER